MKRSSVPIATTERVRSRARSGRGLFGGLSLASTLALCLAAPAFAQQAPAAPAPVAPGQTFEPAYFTRFAPKSAADMVNNIPGFDITGSDGGRGFGQAKQNVLINGRRVSGKSNDAQTALSRIAADSVVRIEIVDGASLNIPGLSGQVANVIAKVKAFSGNWNWNPEFRENLQPSWFRGAVSASGATDGGWSWSARVNFAEFHNGHDGPGVITSGAGQVIDVRREGFNGAGEEPSLAATLTYEAIDGAVANMNLTMASFNFVGREDSFRNPVGLLPVNRFSYIGEDNRGIEIGADYEFDLGPGRLKLIGLQRLDAQEGGVRVESWPLGLSPAGQFFATEEEAGESILRAEYGFAALDGDLQFAAEGAFNFLDLASELGLRQPDGSYMTAPLADGTARVEERRAETNVAYSRQLGQGVSLQSSLGVEYSELMQTGANGLTREFVRPKGFVSLAWQIDSGLGISLKGERKVGQLDFGDFLSSVDLQNNNQSVGNADLVPEQSWIASTEINRKIGPWGAIKLSFDYRLIEDVVDQIPFGLTGSGVGNIDQATAWTASTSGTINLDPLGLKGMQVNFNWFYSDSSVKDPLTGEDRQISWSDKQGGVVSLRWDVPDTQWTISGGLEEYQSYAGYRLDQISRNWQAPSTNFVSIEHKDVYGLKVRLQAVNLNDSSENFRRDVFQGGRRTNPLDFTEERHRTFGPIIRLNVSGTF